jgi:hypothetical protein
LESKAERPWRLAASLRTCNVTNGPHCLSASAALNRKKEKFEYFIKFFFLLFLCYINKTYFINTKYLITSLKTAIIFSCTTWYNSFYINSLKLLRFTLEKKILCTKSNIFYLTLAATILKPRLLPFLFNVTVSTLLFPSLLCPFSF